MNPLICIIIPVYNVEVYLARCLDSVLAQTFQDFEIICIDDASTDDSYRILREYAEKDSRIKILKNEQNKGLSYTRNAGLEYAQGKYVYFLDSDDAIVPECLAKTSNAAENTDSDIVIFGAVEKENGKKDVLCTPPIEICNAVLDGRKLFASFCDNLFPQIQFKLWRRDFLAKEGLRFYEGIYHEDELFYFEALMSARKVTCIPDLLYFYYRREGSIMQRKIEFRHIASLIVIIHEMWKSLEASDFEQEVRNAVQRRIAQFCIEVKRRMVRFGLHRLPGDSGLLSGGKKDLYVLMRILTVQQYMYSFSDEEYEHLKSFEHILVYGAGKIARQILLELFRNNIENIDIVVSSINEGNKMLYGFQIQEIRNIGYPKEKCIVLIAVGKQFQREILGNTKLLGYENVLVFEHPKSVPITRYC